MYFIKCLDKIEHANKQYVILTASIFWLISALSIRDCRSTLLLSAALSLPARSTKINLENRKRRVKSLINGLINQLIIKENFAVKCLIKIAWADTFPHMIFWYSILFYQCSAIIFR